MDTMQPRPGRLPEVRLPGLVRTETLALCRAAIRSKGRPPCRPAQVNKQHKIARGVVTQHCSDLSIEQYKPCQQFRSFVSHASFKALYTVGQNDNVFNLTCATWYQTGALAGSIFSSNGATEGTAATACRSVMVVALRGERFPRDLNRLAGTLTRAGPAAAAAAVASARVGTTCTAVSGSAGGTRFVAVAGPVKLGVALVFLAAGIWAEAKGGPAPAMLVLAAGSPGAGEVLTKVTSCFLRANRFLPGIVATPVPCSFACDLRRRNRSRRHTGISVYWPSMLVVGDGSVGETAAVSVGAAGAFSGADMTGLL